MVDAPEVTDEALMAQYLEGDRQAFRVLFERYSPRLLGLMRQRVYDAEDAQELVQQTFLQFHRARHDFRAGGRVRPWLVTIALNLRRDHLRRLPRRHRVGLDDAPEPSVEPRTAERRDQARLVREAVSELSDSHREVIELHWFSEMSFHEIAEVLGISYSAAKVRAHRAYDKLRRSLSRTTDVVLLVLGSLGLWEGRLSLSRLRLR